MRMELMKYFENNSKYNFVDENNVFVGYDSRQDCCEDANWFLHKEPQEDLKNNDCDNLDWENWEFDTTYFEEVSGDYFESGGMVIFRLVRKDNGDQMYLHLYNCHNGYYGHGFEMKINDETTHAGNL